MTDPEQETVQVDVSGLPTERKWQNLSAFMMKFNSLQFYIAVALILFEGLVLYFGLHLPERVTMSEYLALVGVVHGFLGTIVAFWFANDQRKRELEAKGNGNGQ
jgi:preprotein translocase subunit SecY